MASILGLGDVLLFRMPLLELKPIEKLMMKIATNDDMSDFPLDSRKR